MNISAEDEGTTARTIKAEREAYIRGAKDFLEETRRRFWANNPGGVLYMRRSDPAFYMREIEQEIDAGKWPKGE